MGLSTSLYVGVSGLNSSQSALNVTAHNLVNVDTAGYVRQQVLSEDFIYRTIGQSYNSLMQTGLGTSIDMVRQVRDTFLDKSYRQELGRQGFYEAQYETVQEIEGLFGELEGVAFQDSLEAMWTSIQELAKEPDSIVKRAALIQNAVSFVERSENIAVQLKDYQVNLNTQILEKVDRINEIGDAINELNDKVKQYESSGLEHANDYRDQRNSLLDELGQLVKITYKETAVGVVTVSVEGTPFVTEANVHHMATAKMSESSEMLKPVWEGTNTDVLDLVTACSSENDTDIGSLKGLLIARGSYAANYTDVPVAPVETEYATSAEYNSALVQYTLDVETYDREVKPSVVMTTQAKFDHLINGLVTAINDIMAPTKEISIEISAGVYGKITVLDETKAPLGMDAAKTVGEALFNRKSTERYTTEDRVTVTLEDGTTADVFIYNKEDENDNYSLFTLGEIEVNEEILANYSLIPLSSNSGSGAYDADVCDELTAVWQEKFATLGPETLTKNNFIDYYTAFIGEIANKGDVLKGISENQATTVDSIENQRLQTTGVSSDEELTNMIKYQHAYNAAARYVNVIDEMLEHIVTQL